MRTYIMYIYIKKSLKKKQERLRDGGVMAGAPYFTRTPLVSALYGASLTPAGETPVLKAACTSSLRPNVA